jgi:phage shock protein PspC (stress-responsive transcriptional regulator)
MSGVRKICTNCGFVGEESNRADPDAVRILLVLVLFIFFVIPGIVYLIYLSRGTRMCPACHTRNMIPVDTPLGRKLLGETGQKPGQGAPRFRNKAEYEAWRTANDAPRRR